MSPNSRDKRRGRRLTRASALKSSPIGPIAFFGRTANWTGPRKLQNARTVDQNRKKLVVTGLGMNTIKHVLYRQKYDISCKNKL